MCVTVFGIVTLTRLRAPKKAQDPIAVTGSPSMIGGMAAAVAASVTPVITTPLPYAS
jgi:hypothetical protein